jgi:NAD(P)H dehydrogenase (quinone)
MAARPASEPARHLVVLGHPSPESLNRAIAETYCAAVRECGQTAFLRDLYAEGFDPVLKADERPGLPGYAQAPEVARELKLVARSDVFVLVYPIWFGGPPAIIKGYVDRVLGAGFTPEAIKEGRGHPLLAGKKLVSLSSSATTRPWLEEQGQWHGLRHSFERYLTTIFGMREPERLHFDAVTEPMPPGAALEYLEDVRQTARTIAAELAAERHRGAAQAAVARWSTALGPNLGKPPKS